MRVHVDAEAVKFYALGLQAEALFEAVFAGEEDFAAGADNALPWDTSAAAVKGPGDLARVAGVSGGVGDVAVGGDFAVGDATDLGEEGAEEVFVRLWGHGRRVREVRRFCRG